MPFTSKTRLHETSFHAKANVDQLPQIDSQAPPSMMDGLTPAARATALQFERLLCSAPADLGRISDEIRSHPSLETLVTSFLGSVALSAEERVGSIEEATIVLGTERLRVLVSIWLLAQEKGTAAGIGAPQGVMLPCEGVNVSYAGRETLWTPETIYVASLMEWLGLDARPCDEGAGENGSRLDPGLQIGRVAGLADLLMGDFVSLIPFLSPGLLGGVRRPGPANGKKGAGKQRA
jgi:HDOD domain